MLKLFYSNSVNSLRALIALEEGQFSYQSQWVDLDQAEQRNSWFLDVNPFGLVPVLMDRSTLEGTILTLSQTGAILMYLAEKSGELLPAGPSQRFKAMEWCAHAVSDLSPLNATIKYLNRDVGAEAQSSVRYLTARLWRFFGVAEQALRNSTSGYLLDDLCIADLSVFPVVHHHAAALRASKGFPMLSDWTARIAARPRVKRALAQLHDSRSGRATEKNAGFGTEVAKS